MADYGAPSSYLALVDGTPVYSSDGVKLGEVEHLLADADADIFDGIVIDRSVLPGGHRFVDGSQVEEIFEPGTSSPARAERARSRAPRFRRVHLREV